MHIKLCLQSHRLNLQGHQGGKKHNKTGSQTQKKQGGKKMFSVDVPPGLAGSPGWHVYCVDVPPGAQSHS